jgi:tetratricopeptide (TPR) repeat protein
LLTGRTPFDPGTLLRAGIDQMRRMIREQEPARPSSCLTTLTAADLTTVAARRHAEAPRLIHAIRGDLDWIVMKLLEKDRTRRYETASGVASDIQRHLENEPVIARPPSQLYRFQKLVRRHKLPVISACLIFVLLVLGVTGTTIGFVRSERQRRTVEMAQMQSRKNFDQARATVGDLLAISDDDLYDIPGVQSVRVKLMRAALDRYKPFLEQPLEDPAPLAELGRLYLKYGFAANVIGEDPNTVMPAYESAFAIQEQLVREHPENRSFCADLGWTLIYWKLWGCVHAEANQDQQRVLAIFERLVSETPDDPFARSGLVWSLGLAEGWNQSDAGYVAASNRRLAILEQLVKEYPLSAEFRRDLANQLMWYDLNSDGSFKPEDFIARLDRANEIRAAVVADMEAHNPAIWLPLRPRDSEALLLKPSLVWAKRDLARGWLWTAQQHGSLKQWPQAISLVDRSTALYREVVEQNPLILKFATELRDSFNAGEQLAKIAGDEDGAQTRRSEAEKFWLAHPPTVTESKVSK